MRLYARNYGMATVEPLMALQVQPPDGNPLKGGMSYASGDCAVISGRVFNSSI